jgi:hypothetical protein
LTPSGFRPPDLRPLPNRGGSVLFGAYKQVSGPSGILTLPEAVWELSLGIYLIAKGFRPDASLFERDRRDTEADDLALGLGESAAAVRAQPAGV